MMSGSTQLSLGKLFRVHHRRPPPPPGRHHQIRLSCCILGTCTATLCSWQHCTQVSRVQPLRTVGVGGSIVTGASTGLIAPPTAAVIPIIGYMKVKETSSSLCLRQIICRDGKVFTAEWFVPNVRRAELNAPHPNYNSNNQPNLLTTPSPPTSAYGSTISSNGRVVPP